MREQRAMVDLRLRTKIPADEMEEKVGKMLTRGDVNLLLGDGPVTVRKPDGALLCVYLPGALDAALAEAAYPALHSLRNTMTANRGAAAGSRRIPIASSKLRRTRDCPDCTEGLLGNGATCQRCEGTGRVELTGTNRTEGKRVASTIVGAFDRLGARSFCRLTAWTGRETEKWTTIQPLLRQISDLFREYVPDRWQAQADRVAATHPHWTIEGTVFSTVTVNNTWETAVHTDRGDLDEGFSTIAVLRRGREYRGGELVFPEYRVGVDLGDRDLLLMDAHEWHGNLPFDPPIKRAYTGRPVEDPGFERISLVSYYRTKMTECGSPEEEAAEALRYAEKMSNTRGLETPA